MASAHCGKAAAATRRRHRGAPLPVLRRCREDEPRGVIRCAPVVFPDDAQERRLRPRREVPSGPMGETGEEGLHSAELARASAEDREE
eukprot:1387754-Pyramimonas_sp.AAC.1